ncbi:non-ribosomal peptide synthase/polyketide synthase, partial [Nonomuraea guangzhouensis]
MMTSRLGAGAQDRAIEDIYPLTAMQQGMLLHTLLVPGSGVYWLQTGLLLEGDLDVEAFERAWTLVFQRHAALRGTAVWEDLPNPMWVVSRSVPLPLTTLDWADLDEESQERALVDFLAADLARGAEPGQPTMVRVTLLRLAERRHQMVWSRHHLALDGWSTPIVLNEFLDAYHAVLAGVAPGLPHRRPFRDHVAWALGQDAAPAERFWRKRLRGVESATALEVEGDTGRQGNHTRRARLDRAFTSSLSAFARRHRLTVNTLVQGAWSVLMSAYSGSDDVVYGSVTSGRGDHLDGAESMVGLLLNSIPARVRVERGDPLVAWLRALQREQTAARRFEHTPLTSIQSWTAVPSGQPLFTSVYVFENFPGIASGGDALRMSENFAREHNNYPLTVAVYPGEQIEISMAYDLARFGHATIEGLLTHLQEILQAMVADGGQRVGDLPMVSEAERRSAAGWNATHAPVPAGGVHELVAGRPDAVAVRYGDTTLTYAELDARAAHLAGHLRALGVQRETVVGLCLPRGLDLLVSMLAVWKAGGAYLPLDPDFPAERLSYMLTDSRAHLLITHRATGLEAPATLYLDDAFPQGEPFAAPALPGQAAYMIYTSGSTGRPKGVVISHTNLANFLASMGHTPGLTQDDILLAVTTPGFDIAGLELFLPLTTGAQVVIADAATTRTPDALAHLISASGATVMQATPATWQLLTQDDRPLRLRALCGGEALPPDLAGVLHERTAELWNLYGPTETTIWSTRQHLSQGQDITLGRPIANTHLHVLDQHLNPVPVGVPGELYIGGAGLARGYHHRPALTADRFIAAPGGSRLYRTGDLVRWLADGQLDFLGRTDHQIKLRGHRIEPAEIEHTLTAHPAIATAVVTLHHDRLIAYLVPGAGPIPPVDELRAHLAATLPDYMVPAVFIELTALPRTPNGKLDRAALPAPDHLRPDLTGGYRPPATPTEEVLAGIWADLLGLDRVGAADDFFELGGHSLLATRVVSRVRAAFGTDIGVADLFDQPTVADLAAVIDAGAAGEQPPPIVAVPRDRPLPLSFAQQRLWFLDQMEPGSVEYNVPAPIPLDRELDVAALRAALDLLVARHEVLRTRLVTDAEGVPWQVIDPPAAFDLPLVDLSGESDPARAARGWVAADVTAPFDLATGPLVRAGLLRLAKDRHILALCMHHLVSDEWSASIFVRELTALYEALQAGRPDPLPPLKVQYADFAVWQRGWLAGPVLAEQLGYWRTQLAGAPVLDLPTDRPRAAVRSTLGAAVRFRVDAEVSRRLQEISRQSSTTMFMTLLAAYTVLLGTYSGQDDLVVGTPVANRNHAETENLIGFFVNTLALRANLAADPTFTELLARIRTTALAAYTHQDLPFEQLVDELDIPRDRSRTPLTQVFFNYTGDSGWTAELAEPPAKCDLMVAINRDGDGLAGMVEYSTALFDAATIERLIGHFQHLLTAITADPGQRLSGLNLLTPGEHRQLTEWNTTHRPLPDQLIPAQISARAATHPDRIAVTGPDTVLTYGQLEARANRLAHHLLALGVRHESVVGLCLDRSPDMIIGMLAVWKAGGAYLPLDPGYPADRLSYMLADSHADLLISHTAVPGIPTVDLDDPAIDAAPSHTPGMVIHPDQAAYLIYTSGSTGRAKGTVVSHRNLSSTIDAQSTAFAITPDDTALQLTSFSFDVAASEIFTTLTNGAHLVIADERHNSAHLRHLMHHHQVTITQATPTLLQHLDTTDLPHLRTLVSGGEPCPPHLAELWAAHHRHFNAYGPTEAGICATMGTTRDDGNAIPIGAPLANTNTHVMDRHLQLVPVGVPGELYIGGSGVSRGYHGRPALTAERFVAAPGGSRLYRTGDLVRWRADGQLDFLGRTDQQIKLRGFRIEPAEIEHALTTHPAISAAVVTLHDQRLIAYLSPADIHMPPVAELRDHLRAGLPDHMIPAIYVELAAFPLTPNGKIDRAALPAPSNDRSDTYQPPTTLTEELLAGIWGDLLGLPLVGIADNFFDLGGHSLLATQAVTRTRIAFGTDLSVADLFDHPTIADLATLIDTGTTSQQAPPIAAVPRDQPLPLSFAQQRLWFLNQLEPGSVEYNIPSFLPLDGELDAHALRSALDTIVERHEVLRTRLVADADGVPWQVIDPPSAFELPLVDLTGQADRAQTLIAGDAATPFDLATGPLIRGKLLRLAEDKHLLALCMHHIIFDGWSADVLSHELTALYRAFSTGQPNPLPPLTVQYADFAVWQRGRLTGPVLDRQLDYWRTQLADPPVLDLPTDRPRPAIRSTSGAAVRFQLDAEVTQRLRQVARHNGSTMFMTLLAAYAVLLGKYTGQDDLVVGIPVANRDHAETEPLIGFFVNTLALRADLGDDPTFTELLARVRTAALSAYTHQDLPFEQLIDDLNIPRDRSRTPLVQTGFDYTTRTGQAPELTEPAAKYDLLVAFNQDGDALQGVVEYSTALFDPATVRRLVDHLTQLLAVIAEDPARHLTALPLLTPAEHRQLITDWNSATAEIPSVSGVHELVSAHAGTRPDAIAVSCDGRALTYGELDDRANRLAHHLLTLGVQRESVVGLCLDRNADFIIALLAVWKTGGAYLPLDPGYPPDRLSYMLADSGARLLVTHAATRSMLGDLPDQVRTLTLDAPATEAVLNSQPGTAPTVEVLPAQAAYLIYTSGSTGRPKGVRVVHRGATNLATTMRPVFGIDHTSAVLQFASFSFDTAVWEIIVTLAAGARLVICTSEQRSRPELVAALIRDEQVDVATLPPSLLGMLAPGDLPTLTTLISAGERLRPALAGAWSPHHRMINSYGPTEATVCATNAVITGEDTPIGPPIPNADVYVLDRHLNPVPVGVPGELYIGGEGLARGYHSRPALTAERFIATLGGSRLYRTGDLARWRADGQLDFLGRTDHQIKLRGYRIEPAEIERTLITHPAVTAALVVLTGQRLVAYLVPADHGIPTVGELRRFLLQTLPDHMVPAAFVELAAFPLSPNGKIDRAALPAPDSSRPDLAGAYRPPATPVEEALAGIWGDLLGLPLVGISDNFFDLGGHSLLATQAVTRTRTTFGTELGVADLFDHPTIADLATLIDASTVSAQAPIALVPRDEALPLSFAQQRLWFLSQLEPGSVEYNVPCPISLHGDLDPAALQAALNAVVERHEVLRTRLVADPGGVPWQIIDPPSGFDLPLVDLTDHARAARTWLAVDASTPFDLATGPLIRGSLLRLAKDEHVLALCMHHIVSDEWSANILVRELTALYEAFRAGRPSPLPPLPVQYADFAVWQRGRLTGPVLDEQLGYWRTQLADPPVLDLPTDRPRPAVRSTAGAAIRFRVDAQVARQLQEISRCHGATMFMTLLATYTVLLSKYTGQDDLVVGAPVANRDHPETEQLIGFFVNTLALRADLRADPTFTDLLAQIRATALAAYTHQDLPFEQLIDELAIPRDRSRTPLVQAGFNYAAGGGEDDWTAGMDEPPAKHDLMVAFLEDGNGLNGVVEYSTALFDAATIERLIGHLQHLLTAITADPAQHLSGLPLLTPGEHEQITGWNNTHRPLPDQLIPAQISTRAALHPDRVAVTCNDAALTYGRLEARANQLAHHLLTLGVQPESVIALSLDRSPDMIIAMLAVWKAGATYLPLDPDYPAGRLAYMLTDSGASLLIGHTAIPGIPTVDLDDPAIDAAPSHSPATVIHPDQAAYLIYTSGSTGTAKSTIVSHRNLAAIIDAQITAFGVTPDDTALQLTSFSFDVAASEIFTTLTTGAHLIIADTTARQSTPDLHHLMHTQHVTITQATPTLLQHLDTTTLPHLRTLITGGEPCPPHMAKIWATHHRHINAYGPTEATICATATMEAIDDGDAVSIGCPIVNTHTHVLDPHLQPVPVGVPGELYIGGAGISRGYHNRPALTAERFIAGPDGSRLYRTGDLVRWRADGQLDFLGRTDQQIKLRGFRIEPAEIEHALTSHPAIAAAHVIAHQQRLVAYLLTDQQPLPPVNELRDHLRTTLPDHMIPAIYVELASFPLTPNGKIDRAALPAPSNDRSDTYQPPTTLTEELLAGIWGDLLGLPLVGIADNFFDLGGHSLLATQAVTRTRATFGTDLSVADLFDHPTIADLATLIDTGKTGEQAPPIAAVPRDQKLPLSFAQQRLWFLNQLEPGSVEYNVPFPMPLDGELHLSALEAALETVVERHEVLRTRLVADADGVPWQIIDPPTGFDLPLVDLTGQADPSQAARAWVTSDTAKPFDLATGPLIRGSLLRLGDDEHILALCMHHIVADQWSADILGRELDALYRAFSTGQPNPLPPLTVQYADFAVWQRDWLTGSMLEEQLDYWRTQLADPPILDLPTDRPRPAVRSTDGAAITFHLDAETTRRLQEISRQNASTMFMTLLAAYAVLLNKYTGQDDLIVGIPVANRNHAETENLIGFFVNTLALRTDLRADPTFTDLLAQIRATALAAYTHQDLPFEQLIDDLAVDRDRSNTPLVQTLFDYTTTSQEHPDDSESAEQVLFDLSLLLGHNHDGALIGSIQYSTTLFDPATIHRMVSHLTELLTAITENPDQHLSDLAILTPAEHQLITDWNATHQPTTDQSLIELITAQALARPEAEAIVHDQATLTYTELETRANQLAHHLQALGAGPETIVGLCLERGIDVIIAILATWKTGAAYLPLDPDYPTDRLTYMLTDSQAGLLINQTTTRTALPTPTATLTLDEPATQMTLAANPTTYPSAQIHPEQISAVIYTSGTTGRPKATLITHHNLTTLHTAWSHTHYTPTDHHRWL